MENKYMKDVIKIKPNPKVKHTLTSSADEGTTENIYFYLLLLCALTIGCAVSVVNYIW